MGFHFQQREVEEQREFHRGNGSSSVSLLYRVKEIKDVLLVLNLVTDNSERGMGILSGIRL